LEGMRHMIIKDNNVMLEKKDIQNGLIVIVIVVVLSVLWASIATVPAGHKGVLTTFGKVSNEVLPEGMSFKAPWNKVHDVSIQQATVNDKTGCYSSDQQQLEISYAVLYRTPEAKVVALFREYPGDPFLNLIKPRVEESLKKVVSTMRAEDSIKERGRVKEETLQKVMEALDGLLTINDLVITNIDLSDELERAIERKQVAEQQALAMDYELKREEKAAEIQVIKATAEAEAISIRGEALTKSPTVVLLNAIDKWDGKAPATLVVGSDTGISLIPNNQTLGR